MEISSLQSQELGSVQPAAQAPEARNAAAEDTAAAFAEHREEAPKADTDPGVGDNVDTEA